MNETIKFLLNHRSIRSWKDEQIPEEDVQILLNVAMHTSTSNGMQAASIIRVKNPEIRKQFVDFSMQKYIVEPSELLIFIADNFRNTRIMEEQGIFEDRAHDIDRLYQGITDAALMAQNVAVAAESMGLGFVYFGSILNDSQKVIELLKLPKYTLPVVGMGIGYPNQSPDLKPRMDKTKRVFTDEYKIFDSYLDELEDYDREMATYYDLRNTAKPLDKFTEQVVDKNKTTMLKRSELLAVIKNQGFKLDL